jgi:hypothetical protein
MARPIGSNPNGEQISPKKNEDTIRKLEQAFALDATVKEACYYADISTETYYRWIKEDPKLYDKFERLRMKPILKARQEWIDKFSTDWKACESYLKRKLKDEFSERTESLVAQVTVDDIMDQFENPYKEEDEEKIDK